MEITFNNALVEFYDNKMKLINFERRVLFIIFKAIYNKTDDIRKLTTDSEIILDTDHPKFWIKMNIYNDDDLCNGFDRFIRDDNIIYLDCSLISDLMMSIRKPKEDIFKHIHIIYNIKDKKIDKVIFNENYLDTLDLFRMSCFCNEYDNGIRGDIDPSKDYIKKEE